MEFGLSGKGAMSGLAILLAKGNGQGGGDLDSESLIIGSWAGDRIVVIGDYSNDMIVNSKEIKSLHDYIQKNFKDISEETLAALLDDEYFRHEFEETIKHSYPHSYPNSPEQEAYKKAMALRKKKPIALEEEKRIKA
jgi:hypothetical protein